MKAREWFRVDAKADDPTTVDIHIVDFIGSWDDDWFGRNFGYEMGVTARAFVEELTKLPTAVSTIKLHINSPGGDVQAGVNIANALRDQQTSKGRTVETYVDGIAASIASVIAMAGSKVHIGDNALMMIHNPFAIALGTAAEMRKTADVLDTIRGQIINTYKWHSSMESDAIAALMDAETWMDADEAIANGFATDKVEGLKAAASLTPTVVAKLTVPDKFKTRVDALLKNIEPEVKPVAATAAEILRECKAAGCLDIADELLALNATLDQVRARTMAAKDAAAIAAARVTAEATRVAEISALCEKSKQPELAKAYIAGGLSVDGARAALLVVTGLLDKIEIDAGLSPDNGGRRKDTLSAHDIYADRNGTPKHKE